jgi:hypothetical protein
MLNWLDGRGKVFKISAEIVVLSLTLCAGGCFLGSKEAPTEDVDKAAALFFERFNGGQYDAIYNDAAQKYKEEHSKEAAIENLKKIDMIGKILAHARIKMTFDEEFGSKSATPVYAVRFERSSGEVTLKFLDEDGEWKLLGFMATQRG